MKKILLFLILIIFSISVNAADIIITADELADEAMELAEIYGSDVVKVNLISSNYEEAERNNYVGYNNQNIEGADSIQNYDHSLARKIINYLRENEYDTITLFGDAKLIPPSYYFYNDVGVNTYDKWIPTDFFYASTDYNLEIESTIGRIAVMNKEEAQNYLRKVKNWEEKDKTIVAGGKITNEVFYEGELAALDMVNKGVLGENVEKYFESDKEFESSNIKNYLLQGGAGILYISGHGDGDKMIFTNSVILSDEIMTYNYDSDVPLIISVLCNNGAFDTRLTNRKYLKSFGESIVASEAGGIGFLGAARYSYGVPEINKGKITKEYMTELMDYILESDEERVGEKIKEGIQEFVDKNDMNNKYNLRTVFELSFLGDPNIELKKRENNQEKPELTFEEGIVKSTKIANIKIIEPETNTIEKSGEDVDELEFNYNKGIYLIKADNGKESRIYLGIEEETEKVIVERVYVEEQDEEERKTHDVKITTAELSNTLLKCDRKTMLNIRIENQGERNEIVNLEIKSAELGVEAIKEIKINERDEYKTSYALEFPNAKEGNYEITVNVEGFDSETIPVYVENCVSNKKVEEKNTIDQEIIIDVINQEIKTKPVQKENWVLKSILMIIIAGISMFIISYFLLRKEKRK